MQLLLYLVINCIKLAVTASAMGVDTNDMSSMEDAAGIIERSM